jgi:hypothetical protein
MSRRTCCLHLQDEMKKEAVILRNICNRIPKSTATVPNLCLLRQVRTFILHMTKLRAGRSGFLFPAGSRATCILQNVQKVSGSQPSLYSVCIRGYLPICKTAGV